MTKCIFLDRDGTINVEKNYLHKIEEFEWETGAIEAIKTFKKLGYKVVVITNQAGVGRGYYTPADVASLHVYVQEELRKHGTEVDDFFFCPHHPKGVAGYNKECEFRKPGIGYFEIARKKYDIDYINSYMVGDRLTDLEPAVRLGMRPVLVKTGYGVKEMDKMYFKSEIYENLFEFSKQLEAELLK